MSGPSPALSLSAISPFAIAIIVIGVVAVVGAIISGALRNRGDEDDEHYFDDEG